ncbi:MULTISPECIES: carbonic anhydrase [unclassified Bartonella]|uniref:carbonic anhydrase n=1 Tax=unclassified Bartonella TaxID=2645622 RepID=UPI0021C74006|nr:MULTISPECIES: carbonic anhydrase [unclassified Bartonella]UXN03610.1 carbonic anhydrase [Bartonella sp. HY406]UXN06582.1 carbonic anhydrase [Bartonella sp. HY761]
MNEFPEHLLNGYKNFVQTRFSSERNRYRELAVEGQKPEVMMIACCDSRAAPEIIFDTDPGEVFVMRNIANQVPPFQPDGEYHATSAALEFAVQSLEVKHIVVMGHGRCGGIRAALDMESKPLSSDDFIGRWMGLLKPSAEAVSGDKSMSPAERQTALERISLRYSLANLSTFPWIAKRQKAGLLQLHAAWFDILYGELWVLDKESGHFTKIETDDVLLSA